MKTKFYTLLAALMIVSMVDAQRYLTPQFGVNRTADITYGSNVSVLTGVADTIDLKMDIYTPVGDSITNRPLILVAHTGSFLPRLFNGQTTGDKVDSTVTYTAGALTSMGYVVAAFTYRQGWLPTNDDADVRRGTLLSAAYRGIQDTRTAIRYFRKNAAENGNEYGIDPDKIGVVGIGTGGYLALGAGSLDEYEEVSLDKFIDTRTNLPYIDTTVLGNLYGTSDAVLCLANHVGYSSDIDFSFNIGGALGDINWMDGKENEPAYAGVHCVNDIFAPYHFGPVIVPTTNEFVVNVSGTRHAIEAANDNGSNDILDEVPSAFDALKPLIEIQKQTDVTLLTMQTIKLGTDNFYGFNLPVPQGSPWDWWGLPQLRQVVAGTNAVLGTDFNADTLHRDGLLTNPGMSAEQGKTYFDTIFALMLPRSCAALKLGCFPVSVDDLNDEDVSLEFGPNPASDAIYISSEATSPLKSVHVYSLDGRLVQADVKMNTNQYILHRNSLSSGLYMIELNFEKGRIIKKAQFN